MIKNEKQYQITQKHLKEFKEVLADYETKANKEDYIVMLEINAVRYRIRKFESEIEEYENLQNGRLYNLVLNSLDDIPEVLIKARLAKRWTQATLANKVGLKEQQIQKYEATDYTGASALRLQRIMDALEICILPTMVKVNTPKFDTDDISIELLQEGQIKLKTRMSFC